MKIKYWFFAISLALICTGLLAQDSEPPAPPAFQPKIWGMTNSVIFNVNFDGTEFNELHKVVNHGTGPTRLMKASDGYFYGTTSAGGAHGGGVFYRLSADGTGYTVLYDFTNYWGGSGKLIEINGELFGATAYGGFPAGPADAAGTIYKIQRDGTGYQLLHQFSGSGSNFPSVMIAGSDGDLYGITYENSFFKIHPDGSGYTLLRQFGPAEARFTQMLLPDVNGKFMGIASQGGSAGNGTIYTINLDGSNYTALYNYPNDYNNGSYGNSLYLSQSGAFYGTTQGGGTGSAGTLFKLHWDGASYRYTKLFNFSYADGSYPSGAVVENADGDLLGILTQGGSNAYGVVYKIHPDGSGFVKLHEYGPSGSGLQGSLVEGEGGDYYGLVSYGGVAGTGEVFRIHADGSGFTSTFQFSPDPLGEYFVGTLLLASNGNFYGLGSQGGVYNHGVLYKMSPDGSTYTKLHDFDYVHGGDPWVAELVESDDGYIYGVSQTGGAVGGGVIYKIKLDGSDYSILYELDYSISGSAPYGGLFLRDGVLYGTTYQGLNNGMGSIFKINTDGSGFAVLHEFENATGGIPYGGLVEGGDGGLYGTTVYGGTEGHGVAYRLDADGANYTVVSNFEGTSIASPYARLLPIGNSTFVGTSTQGGDFNAGTIFSIKEDGSELTVLRSLTVLEAGNIYTSLTQSTTGTLYGISQQGGTHERGVLFSINPDGTGFMPIVNNTDYAISTVTLLEAPLSQTIAFQALPVKTVGNPAFALSATASSDLAVQYQSDNTSVATIAGNMVTIVGAGTAVITASQPGNGQFAAATEVQQTLLVNANNLPNVYVTSPGNGAIGVKPTVVIVAKALTGATTYTIQLSPLLDFSAGIIQMSGASSQSFTGLAYSTTYYVRVKTDLNPATFGKVSSFTSHAAELYAYVTSPANTSTGKTVSLTVTSHLVDGATAYTIELNTLPNFHGTSIVHTGAKSQSFSGLSYSTTYYTRVHTEFTSTWGASTSFTTQSAASVSYVYSPANGATGQKGSLNITANTVSGASQYTIQISPVADFSSGVIERTGASRTLAFSGLSYSTLYYSRVATNLTTTTNTTCQDACEAAYNNCLSGAFGDPDITAFCDNEHTACLAACGPATVYEWGQVRSFTTTDASAITYVTSPANGSTGQKTSLNITANTVPGASQYTIQISPVQDFSSGVIEQTGATRTLAFSGLSYSTLYYSRVLTNLSTPTSTACQDACEATYSNCLGNAGGDLDIIGGCNNQHSACLAACPTIEWGQVRSFSTIDVSALSYVTSPAMEATGQKTSLNITANTVPGASQYTIQIATGPDFSTGVIERTGSSRTLAFSGLSYSTRYFTRVATDLSTSTNTACQDACEATYTNCLSGAGGDLDFIAACDQQHSACLAACSGAPVIAWGQVRSFYTIDASALSYVTTPVDNATNVLWQLNITSNIVPGASQYTIQISPESDFSSGVIERTGTSRTQAFSGLLFDTQYYSRVATDLSTTPATACPDACEAAHVDCLSTSAGDPDITIGCDNARTACLAACSGAPVIQWGQVKTFTTGNPINQTYLITPSYGAVNQSWSLYLVSSNVVGATTYTMEVNTTNVFDGTSIVKMGGRTIAFSLAQGTMYFVRIHTNLSPIWGPTIVFTTGTAVSLAYVTSPADGSAGVPVDVTVTSNTVPGATQYTIELNTSSLFDGASIVHTMNNKSIAFAGLSQATTYYTRVKTNLSAGVWGSTKSFSTVNPLARTAVTYQDENTQEDQGAVAFESDVVRVFPNPFVDRITVHVQTAEQQVLRGILSDITGKSVFQATDWMTNRMEEINLDLAAGPYLLILQYGDTRKVVKVMKGR